MDESEEIKTAAVTFVLDKNIPTLIFKIHEPLLAKYPDVTKYDREKVKVYVSDKTMTENLRLISSVVEIGTSTESS